MPKPDNPSLRFHEDRDLFRSALSFTEASLGFNARLIEKDYYCTLLLDHLACEVREDLVFKGGTCLSKVHADFFRLSEDLDFTISMPLTATRAQRRKRIEPCKRSYDHLPSGVSCFRMTQPLIGANNSTQYVGSVSYASAVTGQPETIKVEIGLREPLLCRPELRSVRTLLLNPISGTPAVPEIAVTVMSQAEAYAEKVRAALTRRTPAIRDYFDIDYAIRKLALNIDAGAFVELVCGKLAVPGNDPVDVSADRHEKLERQLDTELKPVLRPSDFQQFDLSAVFTCMVRLARVLRGADLLSAT